MDSSVIDGVVASVGAAIGAYGTGVLTRGEGLAADATVRLGQRVLTRLRSHPASEQLSAVVTDVAANPDDEDYINLLRAKVTKIVAADPELASDLAALLRAAGWSIGAAGDTTVRVHTNVGGIVSTGDSARNIIDNS